MTGITAQHARRILEANLVNLAKKAQEGRPLSSQEIGLLQVMAEDGGDAPEIQPIWASNQVELAKVFDVDRKTVQRWLKRKGNPGTQSDGRFNVVAWKAWINETGLRASKRVPDDDIDATRERARQVLLQNRKLEFHLAVLKKEYIPTVEVKQWGGELGAAIRKVILSYHLLAKSLEGLSAPEIEARLKEAEEEVIRQLGSLTDTISRWEGK